MVLQSQQKYAIRVIITCIHAPPKFKIKKVYTSRHNASDIKYENTVYVLLLVAIRKQFLKCNKRSNMCEEWQNKSCSFRIDFLPPLVFSLSSFLMFLCHDTNSTASIKKKDIKLFFAKS